MKRAAVLLVLSAAAGCLAIPTPGLTDGGRGPVGGEGVAALQPGRSTRTDVTLALGEPDWRSPTEDRFVYYWVDIPVVIVVFLGRGAQIPVESPKGWIFDFDASGALTRRFVEDLPSARLEAILAGAPPLPTVDAPAAR